MIGNGQFEILVYYWPFSSLTRHIRKADTNHHSPEDDDDLKSDLPLPVPFELLIASLLTLFCSLLFHFLLIFLYLFIVRKLHCRIRFLSFCTKLLIRWVYKSKIPALPRNLTSKLAMKRDCSTNNLISEINSHNDIQK